MTWQRLVFVHQFDHFGSATLEAIASLVREAGADAVAVKTHDGLDWMASFDASPLAIRDSASLRERHEQFAAHGLQLVPWCVPVGTLERHREVALAAEVATACGELVIDAEPYAGFWRARWGLGWGEFGHYLAWLRQEAADAVIHVTVDAPYRDYSALAVADWAPLVNGCLLPQDYWTDFREPVELVLWRSHNQLAALGEVVHVLPLNGTAAEYATAARVLAELGSRRLAGWVLGHSSAATRRAFAGMALATEEDEVRDDVRAALQDALGRAGAVEQSLEVLTTELLDVWRIPHGRVTALDQLRQAAPSEVRQAAEAYSDHLARTRELVQVLRDLAQRLGV